MGGGVWTEPVGNGCLGCFTVTVGTGSGIGQALHMTGMEVGIRLVGAAVDIIRITGCRRPAMALVTGGDSCRTASPDLAAGHVDEN